MSAAGREFAFAALTTDIRPCSEGMAEWRSTGLGVASLRLSESLTTSDLARRVWRRGTLLDGKFSSSGLHLSSLTLDLVLRWWWKGVLSEEDVMSTGCWSWTGRERGTFVFVLWFGC